jgi:tetratricopeptide (TPR) repeat protein
MKRHIHEKKYLLSGRRSFFSSGFFILSLVVLLVCIAVISVVYVRKSNTLLPSASALYKSWNSREYQVVYDNSGLILAKHPLDGPALALHGFSAYYLYIEQNDPASAQAYLTMSITSLRNAWYRVSDSEKPQIAYILGKAYYQRGYYYADLSMKYLDYAKKAGCTYDDLAEFRGLAASSLGDYATSIEALTASLAKKPSDILLFTLAKTYEKINDSDKAKQYFSETIRTTQDELLQLKCHYELGELFLVEKSLPEAQAEFESIIEKDPNSADAHYGLGVLYETQGDLIRARAEWRRALKINPAHAGARTKLDI